MSPQTLREIADEDSAEKALEDVVAGSVVRITFKLNSGANLYSQLLPLKHRISIDMSWLEAVNDCVAMTGNWKGVDRTKDFTIKRMNRTDREFLVLILAEVAESLEVVEG